MAKEKYVISSCYSEYETARDILLFRKERMTTFKRHILNETIQYYYILIAKYLLSLKNLNLDFIKTIIRRHIAITVYMYCRDKIENDYVIRAFDDILNKDINIDNLKRPLTYTGSMSLSNPFWDLYLGTDFNTIKESIDSIASEQDELYAILSTTFDYFYYGCKFADLKYYNRSDLLLAYGINNFEFRNFIFKPIGDEYLENWISTQNYKEKDIKERVLGHIINIIMTNDNLDFNKEMKLMPKYYYEMMFNQARKDPFRNLYGFFDADFKNGIATINVEKIDKSFKFKYNDKCYLFSKEGIKEIDEQ